MKNLLFSSVLAIFAVLCAPSLCAQSVESAVENLMREIAAGAASIEQTRVMAQNFSAPNASEPMSTVSMRAFRMKASKKDRFFRPIYEAAEANAGKAYVYEVSTPDAPNPRSWRLTYGLRDEYGVETKADENTLLYCLSSPDGTTRRGYLLKWKRDGKSIVGELWNVYGPRPQDRRSNALALANFNDFDAAAFDSAAASLRSLGDFDAFPSVSLLTLIGGLKESFVQQDNVNAQNAIANAVLNLCKGRANTLETENEVSVALIGLQAMRNAALDAYTSNLLKLSEDCLRQRLDSLKEQGN